MEKLIDLYKKWAGEEPADVIKLAGQGSNRQYFRIIGHDGDLSLIHISCQGR